MKTTWRLTVLTTAALVMVCGAGTGCTEIEPEPGIDAGSSDVTGQPDEPDIERLVTPDDPRHDDYELPEQAGECATDADCTLVCTTQCSAVPRGPVTCKTDPDPLPEDLAAADCLCIDAVCGFVDATAEPSALP